MKNPLIDYENKFWFNNKGERHREDGPAIEWRNGTKEWFINGKHHRDDGPAIEWYDGTKWWCINGKHHRDDGPAIEYRNGKKFCYFNDKFIGSSRDGFTQEDFDRYLRSLKIKEYW